MMGVRSGLEDSALFSVELDIESQRLQIWGLSVTMIESIRAVETATCAPAVGFICSRRGAEGAEIYFGAFKKYEWPDIPVVRNTYPSLSSSGRGINPAKV